MTTSLPHLRLFEERNGITFLECLTVAIHTEHLVQEWERLSGKKLIASNPLDRMIDEATGYGDEVMREFANFVYECVFLKL